MPGSSLPMYAQPTKKHKVQPPSCTTIDVAGTPVNVYGLSELSRGSNGAAPEVCITFHMHGRTGRHAENTTWSVSCGKML